MSLAIGSVGCCIGASRRFLRTAPIRLAYAVFGLSMAFYGGEFVQVFAATEAFRNLGFNQVRDEFETVATLWKRISLDAGTELDRAGSKGGGGTSLAGTEFDGSGKNASAASPSGSAAAAPRAEDSDEPSTSVELLARRTHALFAAIENPVRVQRVGAALIAAWLGILATLRSQFARDAAIGVGIGNFLAQPLLTLAAPHLAARALAPEHWQWTPLLLETLVQVVGIIITSASGSGGILYSAIAGGLVCARALLALGLLAVASDKDDSCKPGGMCARLARQIGSVDQTLVDDALGYALAIAGLIFQSVSGAQLTFPASLILAPLLWVQYLIDWQLTWVDLS
jgi:hypothetical protein